MRFDLILTLKEKRFPIEYRRVILSYIKKALTECNNGKYFEEFFKDTRQKNYCFTVIFPKSKFLKNEIIIDSNEIKISFSISENNKVGLKLFSAFIGQKNKPFPLEKNNCMILKSIKNSKRYEIVNNRVIFKTSHGSAICVREHNRERNTDKYYVYNDEEFREKLNYVISNGLIEAGFSTKYIDEIRVNPIQFRKVVVKHYDRYIDVSVGTFELCGNKAVLQYLYDSGIGSRKSCGFGMVDLVTQDLQ